MKHSACKLISIILVCLMLLSTLSAFVYAGSGEDETPNTVFNLKKVSETADTVVVDIELVSGSFLCFDAKIASTPSLTCTKIVISTEYRNFINEETDNGGAVTNSSNINTGMLSIASTESYAVASSIATFTYTKNSPSGVTSENLILSVDSCYIDLDGIDTEITAEITSGLPDTHEHVLSGEWVVTTEPTCTAEGEESCTCTECGETVTRSIDKISHVTHEEISPPTCTLGGFIRVRCDVCKQVVNRIILPATGHTLKTETKDATCSENGYTKTVCTVCNEVISEDVIPATGNHINTTVETKAASCTEDGYVKTVCTDCGAVIDEKILEKTNHNFVSETKDATCLEDGYIISKCSFCGLEKDHFVISALGHHVWQKDGNGNEWVTIEKATYRKAGVERRTCQICGAYEEQEIPMLVAEVTGIKISMASLTMQYKQTTKLSANVTPEEATYSTQIKWSSSNTKVATVDSNGNVKAVKPGTAVITATTSDGQFSATSTVTVKYSILQWLIIIFLFGWIWY